MIGSPESLRSRILWSLALLTLVAGGLVALTLRELDSLAREEATDVALQAVTRVERALADARGDARLVMLLAARDPAVVQGGERCDAVLADLLPPGDRFENLVRMDGEGNVLCSARPYPLDRIPPGPRTDRTLERLREGGGFHFTAAILDESLRSILLFSGGVEGGEGGLMLGVLLDSEASPLMPAWPASLALVVSDPQGRPNLRLPRGTQLPLAADMPLEEAASRAWGIRELLVVRGAGGEAGLPELQVLAGFREGTRFTPAGNVAFRNVAMLGVVLLLGFVVLLLWVRRHLVLPLEALAGASADLAEGALDVRVPMGRLPREFLPVSEAFNQMAEALEVGEEASATARAALAGSEARYRILFEQNPFPMWAYDPESLRILDVNGAAERVYGYSRGEFLELGLMDLRPPSERDALAFDLEEVRAWTRARRGPPGDDSAATPDPGLQPRVWTHRRKDGSEFPVEIRACSLELDDRPVRLVLALDITERIQAEAARTEAETRLHEILANSRDCVWLQDAETRQLVLVSPGYREIWGRDPDDLLAGGHTFLETVHPDDRPGTRESRQIVPAADLMEEYRILRPDGEVRWIRDRAFSVADAHGKVVRVGGIASDVTERHRLEEQLLVSQRLEAVGQLAGGIAHDFNNLLTVIRGHLALARLEGTTPEELTEELDGADGASLRATALVQQMLAFSRRQILLPEVVELGSVVEETGALVRRVLPDSVEFSLHVTPESTRVRVDPARLEQALLNLAINARDAMPAGGCLNFEVEQTRVSAADSVDGPVPPGDYGVVRIRDSGSGMPMETARRAFEPFFTTKAPGKGSGLGLSMVHGILRQSGGHIQLDSEPGNGTTFTLLLPLHPG